MALFAPCGKSVLAAAHQPGPNVFPVGSGDRHHWVGTSGTIDSRDCAQRQVAELCSGQPWLWCIERLHLAASHLAAHLWSPSHSGRVADPPVCDRGSHTFFFWIGIERTDAQLGKLAGEPATIQRAGFLLVDVCPGAGIDTCLSWLLHGSGRRPGALTFSLSISEQLSNGFPTPGSGVSVFAGCLA